MLETRELLNANGKSYVEKEMSSWPVPVTIKIIAALKRLEEHGLAPALKSRLVEKINGYHNLYEVRERDKGICYRIFFPLIGSICWLVHAVRKKGQKLPLHDIRLADQRAKNLHQ